MITLLVVLALVGLAVALAWPALPPVRRRRLERDDQLAAQRRIAELRKLADVTPDDLPRARDLTRGERRRLTYRRHPIARKRAGRRI